MKSVKYLFTAVAGLALSGCAITNVNDVNTMRTAVAHGGTPFTQALAGEYRTQATYEADNEVEWDDAAWFARKGLRAANGEVVLPANVVAAPAGAWLRHGDLGPVVQIPAARMPEVSGAHNRLVAFLDGGGRDRQPVIAAQAQGLYDCWVEEEWEKEDDIACRRDFLTLETQFTVVTNWQPATAAAPAAKATPFQVFFDFDRSNITDGAAKILQQAAANAKQGNVTHIKLTGHTDSSGTDQYNQALSERRAAAVKAELVKDGVPGAEIVSVGVGKAAQLVPTADGIREPQNRRAEILLQ